ncbi:MAG: hypothetical protein ACRC9K_20395 [Afipia sp.]
MSKTAKTSADLLALLKEEMNHYADCPEGIIVSVISAGDSWEFRTNADDATKSAVGYGECVARIVQIGDHLGKQFDLKN